MKVSKEQRAANHAAIMTAASRLIRERGPEGVNVAQITAEAGLTHGGFYGHFESKDALFAEALVDACHTAAQQLRAIPPDQLDRYVAGYLSRMHLKNPGTGCPLAALAGDVGRAAPVVKQACARGIRELVDAAMAGGAGGRQKALTWLSGLVGAVVLARAVEGTDDALATALLHAMRDALSVAE